MIRNEKDRGSPLERRHGAVFARRRWYRRLLLLLVAALSAPLPADDLLYTIRPGDNLWNLALHHLPDITYYRRLQQYNHISAPRQLKPGSRIRIPVEWLKQSPAPAEITKVHGEVVLVDARGRTRPARAGTKLAAGDGLRTGADGSASIRMADGSRLVIQPGTELRMDTLSRFGINGMVDTRVRLQRGRVDTEVPPVNPPSRFRITTPAATATVRGTRFRVGTEQSKPVSRAEVLRGRVGVAAAAVERVVPKGFGVVAEKGKPPGKPRPLLPPPDLQLPQAPIRRLPAEIRWQGPKGAVAYRFQVSGDADFATLLRDRRLSGNTHHFSIPDLADGEYYVRLRGIDDLGLEGKDATGRLRIDAHPLPPHLLSPGAGERLVTGRPAFSWKGTQGAARYHLQIARAETPESPLVDEKGLTRTGFEPAEPLPPGKYLWRVAAIDGAGKQGPFADWAGFVVKPRLPAPEVVRVNHGTDSITIEWRPVPKARRYRIQASRNEDMSAPLLDRTLEGTRIEIPHLPAGTLYFRLQSIDGEGTAGDFGPIQSHVLPSGFYWPLAPLVLIPFLF